MRPKAQIKATIAIFLMIAFGNCAYAHRPHDNITDVGISPAFDKDGTAFIIVMGGWTLKKSTDHGMSWIWLNKGLNHVYPFEAIALSPGFDNDGTVFVSSGGDGVYKSSDGGNSWAKVNKGIDHLDIRRVLVSPNFSEDHVVLAADSKGKLYRTDDGGNKWHVFYDGMTDITSISFLSAKTAGQVLVGDQKGVLHHFIDDQWTEMIPSSGSGAITAIAVSPSFQMDQTIWIGTERQGVLKTTNSGASFHHLNSKLDEKHVTSLLAYPVEGAKTSLLATTWREALFRSEDGGESWQQYDQGLSTDIQADAPDYMLPHFRGIAIHEQSVFLGGFDGLFLSEDGGRKWRQSETWYVRNISMISLSPVDGEGKQSAFLAYGGGAYLIPDMRSTDWVDDAVCLTLAGKEGVRTDSGISDVVFSPSYVADQTIFAGTEQELIRTTNRGETWSRVKINEPIKLRVRKKLDRYMRKLGLPSSIRLKVAGFFPLTPGWSTYVAVSPNFEEDQTVFFGTHGIGQCLSKDGGRSCSVIFDTTLSFTTSMAISPAFANDKTLFVGVEEKGIYRTEDGGGSFRKSDEGADIIGAIRLALSPEYNSDQTIFAGTGAGLFVSKDGGNSWARSDGKGLPEERTIMHVAVSPDFSRDQTVLLCIEGKGLFKSIDAGRSFRAIATELIDNNEQLKQVRFSSLYTRDKTLLGVSAENVYRSEDGGDSWKLVPRPVRYEDPQDAILYEGDWEKISGGRYSDSTQTRSKNAGSKATLRFYGSGIRVIGEKSNGYGDARIYIDGKEMKKISLRSSISEPRTMIFESTELGTGSHEITLEVIESEHKDAWVALDAFEILP